MNKNLIDIRDLISSRLKKKNSFLKIKYPSKDKIVNKKIKLISKLINENIQNKQSSKFWYSILHFWTNKIIYDVYRCNYLFERIFKKKKTYLIYDIDPGQFTYSESSYLFDLEKFIIFLASEYIKKKKLSFKIKNKYTSDSVQKKYNNLAKNNLHPKNKIKIIHYWISKFFFKFYKPKLILDDLYIRYIDMIKINLSLGQLPLQWSIRFQKFKKLYNLEKRISLINKLEENNFFNNYLNMILIKILPRDYLENFDQVYEYIMKTYPLKYNKYLSGNLSSITEKKIFMQIIKKKGTKIFISQHGGTYGIQKKYLSETTERTFFDNILTWGWKKSKKEKIFFSINFFNYPKKLITNKKSNEILICTNLRTNYFLLPSSQPSSPSICDENFNKISKFCLFLKKKFKSKIIIRYLKKSVNSGFSFEENRFPNFIKFDYAKNALKDVLPKFRLVIHNGFYSTAFLETLYLNKPTLILVNPKDIREYNHKFKQHIKHLIDAGIVHTNNDSLKKFFLKNYLSIEDWWESKKVKKILKNFKYNYVRGSNSPINDLNKLAIS